MKSLASKLPLARSTMAACSCCTPYSDFANSCSASSPIVLRIALHALTAANWAGSGPASS